MLAAMPYTTWPLRVTLFSADAVRAWESAERAHKLAHPLPHGCTVAVELEGVDGKSGVPGSGRTGPIDVTDGAALPRGARTDSTDVRTGAFTAEHLAKHAVLLTQASHTCSVCTEPIASYASVLPSPSLS
jgi:structure-specific endonuclease subunit SLX1